MCKREQVLNVWQRVGTRVGLTRHRASAAALTPSTHWSRPQPGFPRGFVWLLLDTLPQSPPAGDRPLPVIGKKKKPTKQR